jgi:hypothetical protein
MSELKTGFIVAIFTSAKIKVQSGSEQFVMHVRNDAPGEVTRFNGHGACVLARGHELTFSQDDEGIHSVTFDVETPDYPEYEDSHIVVWHPRQGERGCAYGFAERGCSLGCRIYAREDDTITLGVLKVGSDINHAVEEQSDGRVKATKISIYQETV